MYNIVTGDTVNELTVNAYQLILDEGRESESRNGKVRCLNNVVLNLTDPRNRHLHLEGRKSNIAAQIAETFWVLGGLDQIDPVLSFFLPRAKDYSDNGKTWRGAYGPRLYRHNQLFDALDTFIINGVDSRQSVIQIFLPELDSRAANPNGTKDLPCNNELVFFCDYDKETGNPRLNLNVFQRSGDALWGALNINVFEWTVLQEMALNYLNEHIDEEIVMGGYTHFVTNLHLYDATCAQAVDACAIDQGDRLYVPNGASLTCTNRLITDRAFYQTIHGIYQTIIEYDGETPSIKEGIKSIAEVFMLYGVQTDGNLLFDYAMICLYYIYQKKGWLDVDAKQCILSDSIDLKECLELSSFVKWEVL